MDEPPSLLLKSRIPRKTVIIDRSMWESLLYALKFADHRPFCRFKSDSEYSIYDLHCPLRKGIIYYCQNNTIFEHNIHSSGPHEVDSHVAHWESRIRLTMLSSHESLSPNIRPGLYLKCRSSPLKAIGSYYSQSTSMGWGQLVGAIYTYQSTKSDPIIVLVLLCGLSTVALIVTLVFVIWSW